jgi:hypothetical protein
MKKNEHSKGPEPLSSDLSRSLSSDLRGRQSVRATFKLTVRSIDALSIVSVHLGIKQKSLFDHLIDDMAALSAIGRDLEPDRFRQLERVQKTYVISRKTLNSLERASRELDAPRDALVEYSIQRLMPVIDRERRKHRRRKKLLARIEGFVQEGRHILELSARDLGDEDPVFARFLSAMDGLENTLDSITAFIERGSGIEDF